MGTDNIIQDGWQFFINLFQNLRTGILFFGGPYDVFIALLDIFITTLIIYFILKLIRDSRAWQLLKGIVLIVIFSQIFILLGLETIGFILTNTLSVLAIAFVVLFQPELRRALETVGRNSFTILSGVVAQETPLGKNAIYSMIEAIVRATEKLVETNTGALIIIERETKLGELIEQDNAVVIDSAVSATLLLQIFYKGSPLHDGAVLIRNGRINAARCHVPLSDNYHLRKDFGTRHRAAIGISEMGDAISVVVSEERSIVSIAINGHLYTLDNPDALRTILHKQLDKDQQGGVFSNLIKSTKKGGPFSNIIKKTRGDKDYCDPENIDSKDTSKNTGRTVKQKSTEPIYTNTQDLNSEAGSKTDSSKIPDLASEAAVKHKKNRPFSSVAGIGSKGSRQKKFLMIVGSLLISIFIWLYVQITINPVETKSYSVPLTIEGIGQLAANGLEMETPSNTIIITLMGRSKNLANLNPSDVISFIDVSKVTTADLKLIPISVRIKRLAYYKTANIYPSTISIKFSKTFPDVVIIPTLTPQTVSAIESAPFYSAGSSIQVSSGNLLT